MSGARGSTGPEGVLRIVVDASAQGQSGSFWERFDSCIAFHYSICLIRGKVSEFDDG